MAFSPTNNRGYSSPRELAEDEESSSFLSSFRPFGLEDIQKGKSVRRWQPWGLSPRSVLVGKSWGAETPEGVIN